MTIDHFNQAEKILNRAEAVNRLAQETDNASEKNRYLAELEVLHEQMRNLHIDALTAGNEPAAKTTILQRIKEKFRA